MWPVSQTTADAPPGQVLGLHPQLPERGAMYDAHRCLLDGERKRQLHWGCHGVCPAHGEGAGISVYMHCLWGHEEQRGLISSSSPPSSHPPPLLTCGPLPMQRPPLEHFLPSAGRTPHHPSGLNSHLTFSGTPSWTLPRLVSDPTFVLPQSPPLPHPSPAQAVWSSLFTCVPLPLALSSKRAGTVSSLFTLASQ